MDCLNTNQLALYLTTYGLRAAERRAFDRHLGNCPACRERLQRLQQQVHRLNLENHQACAATHAALEAYALGVFSAEQQQSLRQHSSECHACRTLLARLSDFPDLLQVETWEIPVPPRLAEKIAAAFDEQAAATPLRESALPAAVKQVKKVLREIRLTLAPLEPALGFRDSAAGEKSDFVAVEHAGGDLVVNVGAAGVIVELYSNREKYLDDGESDAAGRVVFEGMKPGIYKFKVHGHRIASAT